MANVAALDTFAGQMQRATIGRLFFFLMLPVRYLTRQLSFWSSDCYTVEETINNLNSSRIVLYYCAADCGVMKRNDSWHTAPTYYKNRTVTKPQTKDGIKWTQTTEHKVLQVKWRAGSSMLCIADLLQRIIYPVIASWCEPTKTLEELWKCAQWVFRAGLLQWPWNTPRPRPRSPHFTRSTTTLLHSLSDCEFFCSWNSAGATRK